MTGNLKFIIAVIVIIALIIVVNVNATRNAKERLIRKLVKNYGKRANKKISADELEQITHYYTNRKEKNIIDDITWNDLDMDRIYKAINNTNSSVGQEYLYKLLREPCKDESFLKKLDKLANSFDEDKDNRLSVQKIFAFIGYAKHMAVSDYVEMIVELTPKSNVVNYISSIFLIIALVILLGINASIGILVLIVAMSFSIISYYRFKADVECYFVCINQIVKMIKAAKDITELKLDYLDDINDKLDGLVHSFSKVYKNAGMLEGGNVTGSLSEILLEYLRMLTHVDLIKFNNMVKLLNHKGNEIFDLIDLLGFIESSIAIASFRRSLPYFSIPDFNEEYKGIELEDAYHPLIDNAIPNSIAEQGNILLTGSNASGKSTFLKTIAINAILSQTIYTSPSKYYRAPRYNIFSSMALRDDLEGNNSYYIVEIKSIKRIFDAIKESDRPVLIFIDEVLKGTNTVERVAASSEILRSLGNKNTCVFAATHDVELTSILEKDYTNYHFQEKVTENEVIFDYKIQNGPATTRNAIKLLSVLGFDDEIIEKSNKRAGFFLENGTWES